ncbi:MAG: hypothetical protein M0P57_02315 [Syntrophales bacterium]|nr:hypothetical protein [Syntrophales bacterium]MDY0043335.1 hypothetical protein [Syntrophales bacterium]
MDKERILMDLGREFEATFIEELIPGILHNFANPLNGIMGRSKLLQKRAQDVFPAIEEKGNGVSSELYGKILRDIDLISQESDRLYYLFNDLATKLHRLNNRTTQSINLSDLIESEIAFFEFYLDFKHKIEKETNLNVDIPLVKGIPSDYSIAISTIIRYAMKSMEKVEERRLKITTDYDSEFVFMIFQDTGMHKEVPEITEFCMEEGGDLLLTKPLNGSRSVCNAIALLRRYGARFAVEQDSGFYRFSVSIPYGR